MLLDGWPLSFHKASERSRGRFSLQFPLKSQPHSCPRFVFSREWPLTLNHQLNSLHLQVGVFHGVFTCWYVKFQAPNIQCKAYFLLLERNQLPMRSPLSSGMRLALSRHTASEPEPSCVGWQAPHVTCLLHMASGIIVTKCQFFYYKFQTPLSGFQNPAQIDRELPLKAISWEVPQDHSTGTPIFPSGSSPALRLHPASPP